MAYQYFRINLPKDEVDVYDQISKSLFAVEPRITINQNSGKDNLQQIVNYVLQDLPQIFFVDEFRFVGSAQKIDILPLYLSDKRSIAKLSSDFNKKAAQIISRCNGLGIYDTLLAIHDAIVRNVIYRDDKNSSVHSIASVLTQKIGVCEGYAKTFKYLLDMLNIPCIIIYGGAFPRGNIGNEPHAWNMVKINNSWCHMDITFDATIQFNDHIRYDYFALTDDQIKLDHSFNQNEYPPSNNGEFGYYYKNNLIMKTRAQLIDYLKISYENGIHDIVVKLPGNVPEKGIEEKVLKTVTSCSSQYFPNKIIKLSFNVKHKVFQIVTN